VSVRPAYGANSRGVAELTIGLMLAAARHVTWSDRRLKAHAWERRSGFELLGRTLGVVGLGAIGRTVVELGAALGMTVVGHDVVTPVGWTPPRGFRQLSLPELAGEADVLSLHVPAAGRPVVDADLVARMRPGGVLVNTARGELVDTEPVLAALDEGRIAAYAVDAFETEPPQDWRLADHERVIATPHVGGLTEESVARAAEAAVDAILDALLPGQTGVT
jgi:phosphoglycerate dehydrogenase-like enzyme